MSGPIKERDWKYLRSIRDEMLHTLCARINRKAAEIVAAEGSSPHKQYLKLYRHIEESDDIIADCFNDWRRSNVSAKIMFLRRHGLLRNEYVQNLSKGAQEWLIKVEEFEKL